MRVSVYKDFFAGRFIRCIASISEVKAPVGGAGLTLNQAMARCVSEAIERRFEVRELLPKGIKPVGIAAHVEPTLAQEKAIQEAVETLCLEQIHETGALRCFFHFHLFGFSFGLARTSRGYFAFFRGQLKAHVVGAYSAASSAWGAILKGWEEYRSIHFFAPTGEQLKKFTRANRLFSEKELRSLSFRFDPRHTYQPMIEGLKMVSAESSGRHIIYLHGGKKS